MTENPRTAFIKAATWHGSIDEAEQLLASNPGLATSDIHTAAITGNADAVRGFLAEDATNATAVSEPFGGNALVYLCLSKYLRFNKVAEENFIAAATALLDAGADPNSGFWVTGQFPEFETALYGAAGVAHHAGLTKLLLSYGADPNDVEAVYHSPETDERDAMAALVETGRLTTESLTIMLIRKHDWHDYDGVQCLLEHGADPNGDKKRGWYPLHHALQRSNGLPAIELLIKYKADPFLISNGINAITRAAREGRSDVLTMYEKYGIPIALTGVDELIAACAMGNNTTVAEIIERSPNLLQELLAMGDELLARFCLNNNEPGVRQLLAIGIDVNTPYQKGDAYFGIPAYSLPIHIAAWMANHAIVKLLIEKGARIDAPDQNGNTPLSLAVKATVDSYWSWRRKPDSVKTLLEAGARAQGVPFPSGYNEVDALLQAAR